MNETVVPSFRIVDILWLAGYPVQKRTWNRSYLLDEKTQRFIVVKNGEMSVPEAYDFLKSVGLSEAEIDHPRRQLKLTKKFQPNAILLRKYQRAEELEHRERIKLAADRLKRMAGGTSRRD